MRLKIDKNRIKHPLFDDLNIVKDNPHKWYIAVVADYPHSSFGKVRQFWNWYDIDQGLFEIPQTIRLGDCVEFGYSSYNKKRKTKVTILTQIEDEHFIAEETTHIPPLSAFPSDHPLHQQVEAKESSAEYVKHTNSTPHLINNINAGLFDDGLNALLKATLKRRFLTVLQSVKGK